MGEVMVREFGYAAAARYLDNSEEMVREAYQHIEAADRADQATEALAATDQRVLTTDTSARHRKGPRGSRRVQEIVPVGVVTGVLVIPRCVGRVLPIRFREEHELPEVAGIDCLWP